MAEPEVIVSVLKKGVLPILNYYSAHPLASKVLTKRLIHLWSMSHQRVRVLAFVAIFRLTRSLKAELLDDTLKVRIFMVIQLLLFVLYFSLIN